MSNKKASHTNSRAERPRSQRAHHNDFSTKTNIIERDIQARFSKNQLPPGTFRIGKATIGEYSPVFIIAEIGVNHNGSLDNALRLIDIAKESKASAVKFQKRHLPELYIDRVTQHLEAQEQPLQYVIPWLKQCELSDEDMIKAKEYCDRIGIEFLCTPFDLRSAEFLNRIKVPAFKVSSSDLVNFELLDYLTAIQKPLLLSTGMSLDHEIDATVQFLESRNSEFALLHCVSAYPVDPRKARLERIRTLRERFDCTVGYSGHDIGTALSVVAISLGAKIIEKHVTLDQKMEGPDHRISLLPEEFSRLVANIRESELALLREDNQESLSEQEQLLQGEVMNRLVFRKSVVAARPIARGDTITREMLAVKGPGDGLSPQYLFELVGQTATRNLEKDEMFLERDLVSAFPAAQGPAENFDFGWGKWGFVVRYHDFEPVVDLGVQSMEFHLTYKDLNEPIPVARLKEYKSALGAMSLRVHCCEYIGERLFDLCSVYPDVVQESAATLQRVIAITSQLAQFFNQEEPKIIFNVGAMALKSETRTKVRLEPLGDLIRNLDFQGTRLLAQNLPPDPWYFGGQWKGHYFIKPKELVDFCNYTGQGVCLDLSHAYMATMFLRMPFNEYIDALKPYAEHLHVADALALDAEGLQIGDGAINFSRFFEQFADYAGTWIPEIWLGHRNNYAGFKTAMVRLADIYRASRSRLQYAHEDLELNS